MDNCRLCLSTECVNHSIFGESSNLYQKLQYLPVQVNENDNLPQKICDKCDLKLDICYEFCREVIDSQNRLLAQLNIYDPKIPKYKCHQTEDFEIVKIKKLHSDDECDNHEVDDHNSDMDQWDDPLDSIVKTNDNYENVCKVEPSTKDISNNDEILEVSIATLKSKMSKRKNVKRSRRNGSDSDSDYEPPTSDNSNNEESYVTKATSKSIKEKIFEETSKQKNDKRPRFNGSEDNSDGDGYDPFDDQLNWSMLSELRNKTGKVKKTRRIFNGKVQKEDSIEHDSINNSWFCCLCLVNKSSKKLLKEHYENHENDETVSEETEAPIKLNDGFKCPFCSMLVRTESIYKDHYTHEHQRLPYKCMICAETFDKPLEAMEHGSTHDYNQDLYPIMHSCVCDICPKRFIRYSSFKDHRKEEHPQASKVFKYKCLECDSIFKNITSLGTHRRKKHTRYLVYMCPACGRVLSTAEKYKLHMRLHTGYRPHTCGICGEKFKRSDTLVTHVRTHTGSKPHVCPHCDKGFAQRSALVQHLRNHTGVKPYLCDSCGKNFQSQALLNFHNNSNKCVVPLNFNEHSSGQIFV